MASLDHLRRRVTPPVQRRAVVIDDVDIEKRMAHVVDKTQGRFLAAFWYTGTAFQVPAAGEVWIVERNTGNEWHLWRRRDANADHEALSALSPGDTRLHTPGTLNMRVKAAQIGSPDSTPKPFGATRRQRKVTTGATTSWVLNETPVDIQTVMLFNDGALVDPVGVTLAGKTISFPSIAISHTLVVTYQCV